MAEEKVKTGIVLSQDAIERLRDLAMHDVRNVSTEIEWLINQEWERRQASAPTPPATRKGK